MSARPTTSTVQKKPQAVVNNENAEAKSPTPIAAGRGKKPPKPPAPTVNDLSDAAFRAPGDDDPCIVVRIDPATQRLAMRWYGMDADAAALNLLGVAAELAKGRIVENAQRLSGVVSSLTAQAR